MIASCSAAYVHVVTSCFSICLSTCRRLSPRRAPMHSIHTSIHRTTVIGLNSLCVRVSPLVRGSTSSRRLQSPPSRTHSDVGGRCTENESSHGSSSPIGEWQALAYGVLSEASEHPRCGDARSPRGTACRARTPHAHSTLSDRSAHYDCDSPGASIILLQSATHANAGSTTNLDNVGAQ